MSTARIQPALLVPCASRGSMTMHAPLGGAGSAAVTLLQKQARERKCMTAHEPHRDTAYSADSRRQMAMA